MKKRFALLALCAVLGTGILPGSSRAEAGPQDAPKGAEAWPEGLRYKVSAGDTLWDLSAKYLGSPWKWVELWERNRFLTNPHYIYPGTEITIFPAPARDYAMAGAAATPAPAPAPVAVPPPAEPATPAPPPVKISGAVRKSSVPTGPRTLGVDPAQLARAGEFMRVPPEEVAVIRSGEDRRSRFAAGDKIYLTLKKSLPEGQLLGVYRVRGPITIPSQRPFTGCVVHLVGIVQVGPVEDGVTTGKVRASYEDFSRDDVIAESIPSASTVTFDPGADDLKTVVITGRRENREQGPGDFLYLDKGEKAGIAVGNVFRIFGEDAGHLDESTQEVIPRIEVGRVVVVRTSNTFSTAYVLEGSQSFPPGVTAVRGLKR